MKAICIGINVISINLSIFELIIIGVFVSGLAIFIYKVHKSKARHNIETKRYDEIEMRPIVNFRNISVGNSTTSSPNTSAKAMYGKPTFEEMDYFEDHYLKKAESLSYQYEDVCENVSSTFYHMFDLNRRIKMLEKAIAKYNEWKNYCYDKGAAGIEYFDSSSAYSDNYYPMERDLSGDYIFEFDNREFCNIDFLKALHSEYISRPEESKKHLEDEKIYFYGGPEKYAKYLKRQSLPKEVLKVINGNDGILQKDLYPLFDDYLRNDIQKIVKDLIQKDKITAVKSGNSYMLRAKQ